MGNMFSGIFFSLPLEYIAGEAERIVVILCIFVLLMEIRLLSAAFRAARQPLRAYRAVLFPLVVCLGAIFILLHFTTAHDPERHFFNVHFTLVEYLRFQEALMQVDFVGHAWFLLIFYLTALCILWGKRVISRLHAYLPDQEYAGYVPSGHPLIGRL